MVETKLLTALCALLLMNFTSADQAGNVTPPPASVSAPDAPATEPAPTSSLDPISHVATTPSPNGTDTSSGVTSTLSSDTSTEGKNISEIPQPKKDNNTDTVSPAEAAGPEKNLTNSTTSQPPSLPSGSPTPTSHNPLTSTTLGPSHSAHPAPVDTISTTITSTTTSHHAAVPLPDSTTASDQPAPPTSAPTPEPPKHETTTTTATTQSSSTSSTSSPQELPNSELTTLVTQNASDPVGHPGTSREGHQSTTIPSLSSSTAQTKAHADTPSQLNVGGDTTMVHDSPTLDPLLAGLVSAFIITAVIITLLLFLKLRRRDNRPEFRRLQDLPMDDMMEDTPLSMYSY